MFRFFGSKVLATHAFDDSGSSTTLLLSKYSPPSWQPMLSMIQVQVQHSFYRKQSFYQNFPPAWQAMLSSTTFFWPKTFLLSKFPPPPPLAAHAFKYNIPFIENNPFIKIFPPLGRPCFQVQPSFYQKHSFYQKISPPPPFWQPMLSSTTFVLSKTFLSSKFPPPPFWQPMLSSTTFLLSKTFLLPKKFPPPSLLAAHAFNDSGYQGSSATLPDLSVKTPTGFYTISRLEGFMVYGF